MESRIQYIDVAKGFCMLMIVASHVGLPNPWPGAYEVRVVLFFVLSGYFFSSNLGLLDFVKKKLHTIIIPFLFFWSISYALFYAGLFLYPGFRDLTEANGFFDCFTQKEYFNGPLWFLLALFNTQLLFYFIQKITKSNIIRVGIIILMGVVGYSLAFFEVDLPLNIDVAFTSVPFFAFGYYLRQLNILSRFNSIAQSLFFIAVLYIIYLMNPLEIFMSVNRYGDSLPELYLIGFILSFAYILICKIISEKTHYLNKFLAFVGYNSMYIMCVHHLIYRPIKMVVVRYDDGLFGSMLIFLLTICFCLFTAPIVNRKIPFVLGKY